MANLDRPLYGSEATGTLARALSFRRTLNWGTVAKIPFMSCRPSPAQVVQRARYADAVAAWLALSAGERLTWNTNKPDNLTGFNFFIRLYLSPALAYFGHCIFGSAWFQLSTSPDQPAALEYDSPFPSSIDEFPTLEDGKHSPQAWLWNRAYSALLAIEDYLIDHAADIEG